MDSHKGRDSGHWIARALIETRQPGLKALQSIRRHVEATPGLVAWQTSTPLDHYALTSPGEHEVEVEVITSVLPADTLSSALRDAGLRVKEFNSEPFETPPTTPAS